MADDAGIANGGQTVNQVVAENPRSVALYSTLHNTFNKADYVISIPKAEEDEGRANAGQVVVLNVLSGASAKNRIGRARIGTTTFVFNRMSPHTYL
ncbi:hypothetical protein MAR_015861 [Mya arenaria]|uniref:Uncharacterized protein n=1 Tax=Mya arenaria TaxID=6604 RepID=A0ABY7FJZ1_MYAAR|nr:hypothetical protein MAR_015861 [Mya arenaria]